MKSRLFGNSSIIINMKNVKHFSQADLCINDKKNGDKLMGNVSIDNRIFTQGPVTKLGDNRYRIAPHVTPVIDESDFIAKLSASSMDSFIPEVCKGKVGVDSLGRPNRVITATIDGIEYQAAEIIVDLDKNELQVDGKLTKLTAKLDQEIDVQSALRLG